MTTIKATTKRGQNILASARHYEGTSLRDVYTSYSTKKENAYTACRIAFIKECGKNFHIISHNSYSFCVAWDVHNGVRVETPTNSYLVITD